MKTELHAEAVAEYLNQNRTFFHVFPNLVSDLSVPHPKNAQTVSLIERQLFLLREERDALQLEIDALKNIVGENGQLLTKVYAFSHALMASQTEQEAVAVIYRVMAEVFGVEQVSLLSWDVPKTPIKGFGQLGTSQAWAHALKTTMQVDSPMCGLLEQDWQKGLFNTDERVHSICVIPLGTERVWGVLALGSYAERFSADLGTYFLKEMGRLITARLQRLF